MAASPTKAALTLEHLSKVFQGQRALDDVDLTLRRGEIHALLGQNGSGKSTIVKILAGYHRPESGAVARVDEAPFELGSATAAHERGIRFIHQDLALAPKLTVAENLALGERHHGRYWLSDRQERRAAERILESYGISIRADALLGSLPPVEHTMVAVVRALHHGDAARGILVLDEPTATLPARDKAHLFRLLNDVRSQGGTVLFVTHHLEEVFELADRVTVLRDGRAVATRRVDELDHDTLVSLIVGRPLGDLYPALPHASTEVVLQVNRLSGGRLQDFTFQARRGEILGIAGILGSGAEDVLPLTFGALPRAAGTVAVEGREIPGHDPRAAIDAGLAFVPADRKRLGGILPWTVRENVTLPRISAHGPGRWLSDRAERRTVAPYLARFGVKPADPDARFSSLSGGNQQKVVFARWLRCGARAFLLHEPTAGVDIGARSAIYDALSDVAREGSAVVITSSDLDEMASICDRVVVLRKGTQAAELAGDHKTVDRILEVALSRDH